MGGRQERDSDGGDFVQERVCTAQESFDQVKGSKRATDIRDR